MSDSSKLSDWFEVSLEAKQAANMDTGLIEVNVALDQQILMRWIPGAAFGDTPRKTDFVLPLAHAVALEYVVFPPKGFVTNTLPERPPLDLGPVQLSRSFAVRADGAVIGTFRLIASKRRWRPDELEAFRKGVTKYQNEPPDVIELEHIAQQRTAARQLKEAFAALKEDLRQRPDSALYRMRLAVSLADAGFGASAREEARRAAALDPKNARLQQMLGIVLSRNDFGRLWRRAMIERAQSPLLRRPLAWTMMTSSPRWKSPCFTNTTSRAVVIAIRKSWARRSRPTTRSMLTRSLPTTTEPTYPTRFFCLLYSRRFAEARARSSATAPKHVLATARLLVEATSNGALAAVTAAERLERGEERNQALAGAAQGLIAMRRYGDASALLSAVGEDAKDYLMLQSRAALLSRVAPIDPAALQASTPEDVVRKALLVSVARDGYRHPTKSCSWRLRRAATNRRGATSFEGI